MKIAVMGTGVVAQTITEKLVQLGHQIVMGSRDPEKSRSRTEKDSFGRPPFGEWLRQHTMVEVGSINEAAEHAIMIVNAINGKGSLETLALARDENLSGKIILDLANPLDFSKGMPPVLSVCNTDSLGEQIQRRFPDTQVVKSLNTMTTFVMVNPQLLDDDHHVFISGNHEDAKLKIRELLHSFGWKDKNIIDLGDITTARGTEQILPLWIRIMSAIKTPMFNFKIVTSARADNTSGIK